MFAANISFPTLETFLAVRVQLLVVAKIQIESVFRRCVELAILVRMVATYLWARGIDTASAVDLKMLTLGFDQQGPAIFILVCLDVVM